MESVRAVAERWLAAEPDADVRDEIERLLDGPPDLLAERFVGGLEFGTAGLRAEIGAGPRRMNRLVVRRAAAGLADHLSAEGTASAGCWWASTLGARVATSHSTPRGCWRRAGSARCWWTNRCRLR